MQAFAKDSANNTMGGSGPVNKDINFNQFHGRGDEGFTDYATSGAANPAVQPVSFEPYAGSSAPMRGHARPGVDRTESFNPIARGDPIHAEETMGLGTSTFLDGAPAPRAVIQQRETESEATVAGGGGLSRKRSLAQKIRGINNRGDRSGPSGRINTSSAFERTRSPNELHETQSAGGMPRINESKPFFNDYDEAYERKGQQIQMAEESNNRSGSIGGGEEEFNASANRARAVSSPRRAPPANLERRVTNDAFSPVAETDARTGGPSSGTGGGGGGGFLSRVKSLKGGKRSRPERA